MLRCLRNGRGQATVELAVVLPVAIAVALITVNALTFFGHCAAFDRAARQAICSYGAAPGSGQGHEEVRVQVRKAIERAMGGKGVKVDVRTQGELTGLTRFTATLRYTPTLFGVRLRDKVFGVSTPALVHEIDLVVDCYRPGILF